MRKLSMLSLTIIIALAMIISCKKPVADDPVEEKCYTMQQINDAWKEFPENKLTIPVLIDTYAYKDSLVREVVNTETTTDKHPDAEYMGRKVINYPIPKTFDGFLIYLQEFYNADSTSIKSEDQNN